MSIFKEEKDLLRPKYWSHEIEFGYIFLEHFRCWRDDLSIPCAMDEAGSNH